MEADAPLGARVSDGYEAVRRFQATHVDPLHLVAAAVQPLQAQASQWFAAVAQEQSTA